MRTLKARWKNINSYGNQIQELDFTKEGSLNLLIGENGHGKSTVGEVLELGWFGKVTGKNQSQLPNRINKELWVEIEGIVKGGRKVKIERGISPNIFNVWIDGKEFDKAGKSNVQAYLEDELYDIPHQVFKNILVLNIDDFKSFITMSPGDKRKIIDRLFGFTIINQMTDIIKSERKLIKEEIKTTEDELNIINESIESINKKLSDVSEQQVENKKEKIELTKKQLSELKNSRDSLLTNLRSISSKESGLNRDLKIKTDVLNSTRTSLQTKNGKINLLDKSCCPQCERPWDSHDIEHKNHLKSEVNKLNEDIIPFQSELESVKDKIRKLKSFEIGINKNISSIDVRLGSLFKDIQELTNNNTGEEFEHLNSLLSEQIKKNSKKKSDKLKKGKGDNFLQLAENVLGEDGVKNLALKSILPALNANISTMSSQMHLPYTIRFDEKFNCIITSLGEEISPKTLSSGQRKKTDFVIVISLIKLMAIRYPNLNLLFLDELLQSVDVGGRYEILKILRGIVDEYRINAWVINHSELPIEQFDNVAKAILEGGFSKLEKELVE
jgi:DNA repair exonuclease SbcCD ATPase subunit